MGTRQTFDGSGNLISEETIPDATLETPSGSRLWWPNEFVSRLLTPGEVYAVETSVLPEVVLVRSRLLSAADQVNLDSPTVVAAVDTLRDQGILSTQRHAELIAGNPVA